MVHRLSPRASCARSLAVSGALFLALLPLCARASDGELHLAPPRAGVHLVLERGAFRAGPLDAAVPRCVWRGASEAPIARDGRWIQPLARGVEVGYEQRAGLWCYDLAIPSGVPLADACFEVEGAARLELDAQGELRVHCVGGVLEHSAPRAWILARDGSARATPVRFALGSDGTCGFEAPQRALAEALVIDPGLRWSGVFGGSGDDLLHALVRAADGDWLVCGETSSQDLPGTALALQPSAAGAGDAFVARIAADGRALRWATYLGGSGPDVARALCVAPDGTIWVAGSTGSTDFPTTSGALRRAPYGARDAFVSRVSADGRALLAATYVGGSGDDEARACAWVVDHLAIAGSTSSLDLPTSAQAFQPSPRGLLDGFALELSADATRVLAASYVGGAARDEVQALLFDGELVFGGATESSDLPTTPGALQATVRGADLFLVRCLPGLGAPRCVTYFGGSAAEHELALASDGCGQLVLGTSSSSDDLPTTSGAYARSRASSTAPDAFLAVLDADLTQVLAGTYLGGTGIDGLSSIAVGPSGEILAAGLTLSSNFPRTSGALQSTHASLVPFARHDAWLARFDVALRSPAYASYLGGSAAELAPQIAWDPDGDALIALATGSADFPRVGGALGGLGGGAIDLAAARVDLLPAGMDRYGRATAGPRVTPLLWANEPPSTATASFRLGLRGAGAHAAGLHFFAPRAAAAPWSALGVELWLDPTAPAFLFGFACDAEGSFVLALAAPPGLAGQRVHVQSIAWDPALAAMASSAAYELTLR